MSPLNLIFDNFITISQIVIYEPENFEGKKKFAHLFKLRDELSLILLAPLTLRQDIAELLLELFSE